MLGVGYLLLAPCMCLHSYFPAFCNPEPRSNCNANSDPNLSARQHPSYGDCLEVKRQYYQNCSVLDCVTQCLQSAAHSYEQFVQV